jgi:hypothetical protein
MSTITSSAAATNGRNSRSGLTPERGQQEDEEREDELEGHVLGDDERGELVDPVDDEKEREHADADGEGRDELLPHIAVEESHHRSLIVR